MRVKVQLDINKPLKRWLRLKLDKSDNIVVVGLKYERLPEFCYACGKIGHGIKECLDMEAMTEALEGKVTKFGSWMRTPIPDRLKNRYQQYSNGSSTDKDRLMEGSREEEKDGPSIQEAGSFIIQKGDSIRSGAALGKTKDGTNAKTLITISGSGEVGPNGAEGI
ncbi:hypothetical protein Dsin_030298 [Dipteronia sinensis]|uniref:CCHC-type domain-containing protein n=1 Tax=Dipteronia sinensis TaxID=43782 RepID=A0AAD9ZIX5_9ROSI|nr:hypothetical protein Dsin_030298 [Dipteronia sinensis]